MRVGTGPLGRRRPVGAGPSEVGVTFDAGMLVALGRDERAAWLSLRRAVDRGEVPTVPTPVTVQVWRGGSRQARLAAALKDCRLEPLTERLAKAAGELCGRAGTSDVVDAVVVASAARRHDRVYTGDEDDLERLAGHLVDGEIAILGVGGT